MIDYNKILSLCVAKESGDWREKPFVFGDKVMSTDSYIMVMIDKSNVPEITNTAYKDISGVIPESRYNVLSLSAKELSDHITNIPKIKLTDYCKGCDGRGHVEWQVEINSKDYFEEFDCPICKGHGDMPNGKKGIDSDYYFQLGNSIFSARYVYKICEIASILDSDVIELVYQNSSNKCSVFSISGIELLLMPAMKTGDQKIVFKTK